MDLVPDTLDEAIVRGLATEEDRCPNEECGWCHPSSEDASSDAQARAEVTAGLNRFRLGDSFRSLLSPARTIDGLIQQLEAARETIRLRGEEIEELVVERDQYARRLLHANAATEQWQCLLESVLNAAWEWREKAEDHIIERDVALELVGNWQQRALLLEAAVKTYASHVWNDIEARLSGVDV